MTGSNSERITSDWPSQYCFHQKMETELKQQDLSCCDILCLSTPTFPNTRPCSHVSPATPVWKTVQCETTLICQSHKRHWDKKKITRKGNRAGKYWWYYSLFRIIYISCVTLTTSVLRHQVSHINHSVTWVISILRAVILKELQKRFMKAPEWSLPSGLVKNHFFCSEVLWYS